MWSKIPLGITVLGQCNAKLNPQRVQTFFFPSEKKTADENCNGGATVLTIAKTKFLI